MRLLPGLLLFAWLRPSHCYNAFEPPISVATDIAANASVQAIIADTSIYNGATTYVNAFRVYLGTSAAGDENEVFYHDDCNLLHEQTICDSSIKVYEDHVAFRNTTFEVTIPASVGPSGRNYVLNVQLLQTDGSYYGGNIYSNVFDLTGATGTWGIYRTKGYTLWGADGTPCTGYSCVQNCSEVGYNMPGNNNTNREYQQCANTCPGVSIDFENSTRGGQPTASLTSTSSCMLNIPTSTSATRTGYSNGYGATASATAIRTSNAAIRRASGTMPNLFFATIFASGFAGLFG